MADTEHDELESGVQSLFWGRVRAHYEREWGANGERYRQAIEQAVGGGKSSDDAIHSLRMVVFAQKELARFLQWPDERLAHLRRTAAATEATAGSQSRRGPGL